MDIHMSDIMLHIDEDLNQKEQLILESQMRDQTGVIGLGYHGTQPHLMIVEYDRDATSPKTLLHAVNNYGLHAELVGFL
ncbi:MAG: ATP-binding protein [endosymbiont of Galathealinum brachiosum]|uniref:ATP-binding protein n=1 Tax=endosymbiont of Galathealinum brachiosum TaxID=2200906 RepID=A0A370DAA9_9GAMM|nr:MAG: ATP-binding protein [endosymbiont of Galathealinum brachiosum]